MRGRPGFMRGGVRGLAFLATLVLGATLLSVQPSSSHASWSASDWPTNGHDLRNTRSTGTETAISKDTASRLRTKWKFATHGDVSATPAVVGGAVYFPDWGGYLYKVDARTGRQIWSHRISEYNGIENSISRSSPAVVGNRLYLGDWDKANLMAIDTATGKLVWRTRMDAHPAAVLTASPVVHDGVVYQGISSRESESGLDPDYKCCTFRGSATAVDADTGKLLWRRYTVPDNGGQAGGYSGGAIWGTPAIDPETGTAYFTTGQNYTVPQSVSDCQDAGHQPSECLAPDDYIDTVLALDMRTGTVKWNTGAMRFDAWNTGCLPGFPPNNCPANPGYDYDFGDGAHLFTIKRPDGSSRKVIGAGEKSGEYWLLDAHTGDIVWSAAPGPGGHIGGIMWGTAYDGKRIYLAEANWEKLPYQTPDGKTLTGSSFAALDPATGRILWQVADPSDGHAWAPLSVANGVVFGSSTSGRMYAMDAQTGRQLWDFQAPYSSNAGPAIVDGTVYWGNGYVRFKDGAGTTGSTTEGTFYAFSVDGT